MPETESQSQSLYDKIMLRHSQLEDARRPHEDVYKSVIEFIRPEISKWTDNEVSYPDEVGQRRNIQVYSGTPEEALEAWADGMQGHLVSSSLDWFNLKAGQQRFNSVPQVRTWLQTVVEVFYSLFRRSNFYQALGPVFRDAGSIGDTILFIEKTELGKLDFRSFHPKEVYHAKEIFHRKFTMTAKDAVDKFGKEKLSTALNNNLKTNPFTKHTFIHACYKSSDPILKGEKNIPKRDYVSIHIEVGTEEDKKKPVRISGYRTKPWSHWAYQIGSDSEYGWGLGCSALVDICTLNEIAKTNMKAQQLAVDPPLWAHRSLRGRLNIRPAGKTYYDDPTKQQVKQILDRLDIPFGLEREDRLAQIIDRRFNVDFFLALSRSETAKTAYEISEIVGERSVLMAPKIGRMESDLLSPTIDRIFNIAMDEGWIPNPPDILTYESDGSIDVEYLGPLAQAQRRVFEDRRNQRIVSSLSPLLQLSPQEVDRMKVGKSVVRILRDNQWPEDEIATEEEVEEIRAMRAKAQQQMAQAQMMAEAADRVPKLQKASEKGSPLDQMIGGGE